MDKSPVRVPAARKRKDGSHHPHHRILSIEVEGGFLDGTRLEFSDGLNCIIGGRGTGKTTVLEFIRYILGMMPDVNDSRPRAKAIEGHVRGNLGSGTIYLEVETKHGTRYRIKDFTFETESLIVFGEPSSDMVTIACLWHSLGQSPEGWYERRGHVSLVLRKASNGLQCIHSHFSMEPGIPAVSGAVEM